MREEIKGKYDCSTQSSFFLIYTVLVSVLKVDIEVKKAIMFTK